MTMIGGERGSSLISASSRVLGEVRRALLQAVSRYQQVRQFEQAYRRAALTIPGIVAVEFQDRGDYLDVSTIHRGSLDPVEDSVYELESIMMRAFPDVHPSWHFVEVTPTTEEAALYTAARNQVVGAR